MTYNDTEKVIHVGDAVLYAGAGTHCLYRR